MHLAIRIPKDSYETYVPLSWQNVYTVDAKKSLDFCTRINHIFSQFLFSRYLRAASVEATAGYVENQVFSFLRSIGRRRRREKERDAFA